MPTSHEFDLAAAMFENAARDAETILQGARALIGPDVMRGGRLPLLADLTLDTAEQSARLVTLDLRAQAEECRRRSEICRSYADRLLSFADEMTRWERELAAADGDTVGRLRPRPRRPARPPSWVEV